MNIGISVIILILAAVVISAMLIIDTVEDKADYLRIGKLKLADDVDKLLFLCRAGRTTITAPLVYFEMTAASITAETGGVSMNI